MDQTARRGEEGGCTIKISIIGHRFYKYDMLFHTYLDLLPLNIVYYVLENVNYVLEIKYIYIYIYIYRV